MSYLGMESPFSGMMVAHMYEIKSKKLEGSRQGKEQ